MTVLLATSRFGQVPEGFLGVCVSQGRGFGRIDGTLREAMPSPNLLDDYRHGRATWEDYKRDYRAGLEWSREAVRAGVAPLVLNAEERGLAGVCFLCYEATPEHCHRRLLLEWLAGGAIAGYDVEFLPPR